MLKPRPIDEELRHLHKPVVATISESDEDTDAALIGFNVVKSGSVMIASQDTKPMMVMREQQQKQQQQQRRARSTSSSSRSSSQRSAHRQYPYGQHQPLQFENHPQRHTMSSSPQCLPRSLPQQQYHQSSSAPSMPSYPSATYPFHSNSVPRQHHPRQNQQQRQQHRQNQQYEQYYPVHSNMRRSPSSSSMPPMSVSPHHGGILVQQSPHPGGGTYFLPDHRMAPSPAVVTPMLGMSPNMSSSPMGMMSVMSISPTMAAAAAAAAAAHQQAAYHHQQQYQHQHYNYHSQPTPTPNIYYQPSIPHANSYDRR